MSFEVIIMGSGEGLERGLKFARLPICPSQIWTSSSFQRWFLSIQSMSDPNEPDRIFFLLIQNQTSSYLDGFIWSITQIV